MSLYICTSCDRDCIISTERNYPEMGYDLTPPYRCPYGKDASGSPHDIVMKWKKIHPHIAKLILATLSEVEGSNLYL